MKETNKTRKRKATSKGAFMQANQASKQGKPTQAGVLTQATMPGVPLVHTQMPWCVWGMPA